MWCIKNNYGGLENLSLIPGFVGAAPIQNIGAYGIEQNKYFVELEAIDTTSFETHIFNKSQCQFSYRNSIFKNKEKGKKIIISVTYKLTRNKHKIFNEYGNIKEELIRQKICNPNIINMSDIVISVRQSKLPDPKIIGNAGSFFKNPELHISCFKYLQKKYHDIKFFPVSKSRMKLSAGWLIEKAGWKGKRFGDTGIHKKQALVIVNYGNANGKEIFELSENIIEDIYDKFEIVLDREVNVY